MTQAYFSYPRITLIQATQAWSSIRTLTLENIRKYCDATTVTGAEFYAFAEIRSDDSELHNFRKLVVDAAIRNGFPNQVSSRQKVAFEAELLQIFHNEIAMSPSEASSMEIWHFFNLKLLADITMWRFGTFDTVSNHWSILQDRLYSFHRNMFGRIWWRNHLFGVDLATRLGEDATVQIVERTALFAYPPFAKSVAARALDSHTDYSASQLLRVAAKLFSRRMAVLSIFAMNNEQVSYFTNEVFNATEIAMQESPLDA